MKKFSIIVLAMMGFAGGYAQETETDYVPIVQEGRKWVYYQFEPNRSPGNRVETLPNDIYLPITYEFSGDTLVDYTMYKKLYMDRTYILNHEIKREKIMVGLAYETQQCVYARSSYYEIPLVGILRRGALSKQNLEYMIYGNIIPNGGIDLQLFFDDVPLTKFIREKLFTFTGTDYIEINGTQRIRYKTSEPYLNFIEGIGYVQTNFNTGSTATHKSSYLWNFFNLQVVSNNATILSHVIEDGEVVFKGELYNEIQLNAYDPDKPVGENVAVEDLPVDTPADGSGPLYDLQGRVVTNPAPGIYVRNGQKVVVE